MDRNEIIYIIEDYCSKYEIELTPDQLEEVADHLGEEIADTEEYNARCGIHSVNVDLLLDSYFDNFDFE